MATHAEPDTMIRMPTTGRTKAHWVMIVPLLVLSLGAIGAGLCLLQGFRRPAARRLLARRYLRRRQQSHPGLGVEEAAQVGRRHSAAGRRHRRHPHRRLRLSLEGRSLGARMFKPTRGRSTPSSTTSGTSTRSTTSSSCAAPRRWAHLFWKGGDQRDHRRLRPQPAFPPWRRWRARASASCRPAIFTTTPSSCSWAWPAF